MSRIPRQPDAVPSITPPVPPPEPIPGTARTGQFLLNPDGTLHIGLDGRVQVNDPNGQPCCLPCGPCEYDDACAYCLPDTSPIGRLAIFADLATPSECTPGYPQWNDSFRIDWNGFDPNGMFCLSRYNYPSPPGEGYQPCWHWGVEACSIRVRRYFDSACINLVYDWVLPYWIWAFEQWNTNFIVRAGPSIVDYGITVPFFYHLEASDIPDCRDSIEVENDEGVAGIGGRASFMCASPSQAFRDLGDMRVRVNAKSVPQSAIAEQRAGQCKECDEFGQVCELQFPDGRCCGWLEWLADPKSRCPLDRWQPEADLAVTA